MANPKISRRPKAKSGTQKSKAVVGRDRLSWRCTGNALALYYGKSEEPLLHVEPDAIWPGMFRVRTSSGVSDMVNLTRAKDAAVTIALRDLNSQAQEKPSEGRHIRLWAAPLGGDRPSTATELLRLVKRPRFGAANEPEAPEPH